MKKVVYTTLFAAVLMVSAPGCKKKPPGGGNNNTTPTEKGVALKWTGTFNGNPIEYKTGEMTRSNGEIMRVSNWAMILSKLALVKSDDSHVPLGDGYLYIDFVGGKTSHPFATAPVGDYKGLYFQLGLDSAINHGDPSVWSADHPLNGSNTGLHWGWAGGYIFQALDGTWKPNSSAPSWQGISLHTAGDAFTKTFFVPFVFSVTEARKTIQIQANIAEFFENPVAMSFAKDGSFSHSVGSAEVALMNKILGNAGDVFTITEVK